MKWEVIPSLGIQISDEVRLISDERIVRINLGFNDADKNLYLANHNVFRLNARNQVVWQVSRIENSTRASQEKLNRMAREEDPTVLGFLDPFWTLGLDETAALDPQPQGVYRPGCAIYLTTRWWAYKLDPETGIATCTGEQIK